jgi:hypothetical protein
VVLIAETKALAMAVKREMSVKRLTNLRQRLQAAGTALRFPAGRDGEAG